MWPCLMSMLLRFCCFCFDFLFGNITHFLSSFMDSMRFLLMYGMCMHVWLELCMEDMHAHICTQMTAPQCCPQADACSLSHFPPPCWFTSYFLTTPTTSSQLSAFLHLLSDIKQMWIKISCICAQTLEGSSVLAPFPFEVTQHSTATPPKTSVSDKSAGESCRVNGRPGGGGGNYFITHTEQA